MAWSEELAAFGRVSMWRGVTGMVALLALLLLWPSGAHGHALDTQRKLVLQVGQSETLLLVLYELPGGRDAELLWAMHDSNRDGALSAAEEKALAAAMTPNALRGLLLVRDDAELEALEVDWRLDSEGPNARPVLLALLVRFEGGTGRYEVHLKPGRGAIPTTSLELEVGEGLWVSAAVSSPDPDGIGVAPLLLSPDDTLWYEVEPRPAPAPGEQRR